VTKQIPRSLRPALEAYAERLRVRFGSRVRGLVLFGSWARGEAHEDSDVDVLVLVDRLTPVEAWHAAGDAAPVALETGLPLAPLPMASEQLAILRAGGREIASVIDGEGISL
jgi:predicted nucleotidyltransferase